jgi:hypothetical protein
VENDPIHGPVWRFWAAVTFHLIAYVDTDCATRVHFLADGEIPVIFNDPAPQRDASGDLGWSPGDDPPTRFSLSGPVAPVPPVLQRAHPNVPSLAPVDRFFFEKWCQ